MIPIDVRVSRYPRNGHEANTRGRVDTCVNNCRISNTSLNFSKSDLKTGLIVKKVCQKGCTVALMVLLLITGYLSSTHYEQDHRLLKKKHFQAD